MAALSLKQTFDEPRIDRRLGQPSRGESGSVAQGFVPLTAEGLVGVGALRRLSPVTARASAAADHDRCKPVLGGITE